MFDGTVIVDKGKHQPFIIYFFLFGKLKLRTHFSMAVRTIFERLEHPFFIRSLARISVRVRFRVRSRLFSRLQSISRCINALLSSSHVENKNEKNQKGRARSVKTGGVFPVFLIKAEVITFRCHPLNNEENIDSY